jgi:hypothetical protein
VVVRLLCLCVDLADYSFQILRLSSVNEIPQRQFRRVDCPGPVEIAEHYFNRHDFILAGHEIPASVNHGALAGRQPGPDELHHRRDASESTVPVCVVLDPAKA